MPDARERSAIVRLGQFGWGARAVSMALISFFLIGAAVTYDAAQAGGVDGSMRQFTQFRWGQGVVAVVAVGFIAYGLFCIVSARHQRLGGPRND